MARRAMPTSLFTAALLCLATAGGASAAPAWLPPQDLSAPGGNASDAQIAVDPQGDSFAVWRRSNGSNVIVQAAMRPAGGSWTSPPQDLSNLGFDAFKEHVDVDPSGNAVAAWVQVTATGREVRASTLPAGSTTWGAPQTVSDSGTPGDMTVVVGPRGDAIAIWTDGFDHMIKTSRRPAGSSTWGPVKDVSALGESTQDPRVAVDPFGNAVAVYVNIGGAHHVIEGATLPAGASDWTAPKVLSDTSNDGSEPDVAVDPSGNAVAVWTLASATFHVEYATLAAGAANWSTPLPISADSTGTNRQHIVIDGAGNAYASWRINDGTNEVVQAAIRPPGGSWSPPQTLSAPGQNAFRPDLGVDAAGNCVVVWERFDGSDYIIQAAVRPAGAGSWGPSKDLSAVGQNATDARVGVDAGGDATADWSRSNGTNTIVQAAGYDAAGPQLRSFAVPASGKAFTPIAFSVLPLDVWSPLASLSWSFGDGSAPVGGNSVSHTFTSAGSFPVTASATDSLGNASSAQGTIAITLPKPALSAVRESRRVWREGRKLPQFSRKRKAKVGTTFTFNLNEPAKVTFVFKHKVKRRGHRRTVVAGRLGHAAHLGPNKLKFQGRLSRRKRLALGRYTVTITAKDQSGQRSAPKTLSFRIVR